MTRDVLRFGDRITVLPIIHGSGDFALEVRRVMLEQSFDCLAVPLPPSFQHDVEAAVAHLPAPTVVLQRETPQFHSAWNPDSSDDEFDEEEATCSYVPVDPCQGVIMALRVALGEHLPRHFIDLETARFQPYTEELPDPYALKQVALARFATAVLPSLKRPAHEQRRQRIAHMAARLHDLESRYRAVLFVCSILDWPWLRDAYLEQRPCATGDDDVVPTESFQVEPRTLIFGLGELPFITGLYERARQELDDDENLSIDGVKELLLVARDAYRRELKRRARRITPHTLALCLKYIRNLSLIERRLTPDLYTIVMAAKQMAGDQYALHVAETAREYPFTAATELDTISLGIGRARFPNGDITATVNRLEGPPVFWRSCELRRRPEQREIDQWKMRWNPFSQCSYPPEDQLIENFRSHVFDRARGIMGADLIQTEKFTTSIKDGIDIRDTVRHWYEGDIYVKVLPPSRGKLDCAVMLFDSPADPRDYPWRTTWFAEHEEESTLAFFATDFHKELVGPGIGLATYGGALFLYPPIPIVDVWLDKRLDFAETMEERILGAACMHSQCPHIALLSAAPPGAGWRRLAKRFKKKWVHIPLGQFGDSTVQQLRMVHVLNGKEVRSYAADFIRRA